MWRSSTTITTNTITTSIAAADARYRSTTSTKRRKSFSSCRTPSPELKRQKFESPRYAPSTPERNAATRSSSPTVVAESSKQQQQPSPNTVRYRKKAEDIKRRLDDLIEKYCAARKEYGRHAEDLRARPYGSGKISVAPIGTPSRTGSRGTGGPGGF